MKKLIVLLFLGISFVLMILISYMKFQTLNYLGATQSIEMNDQIRDQQSLYDRYQVRGYHPFFP